MSTTGTASFQLLLHSGPLLCKPYIKHRRVNLLSAAVKQVVLQSCVTIMGPICNQSPFHPVIDGGF